MVIGIGGNIGYEGGFLPIKIPGLFPNGLPAIATAASKSRQEPRLPLALSLWA
jgi:hypothetical protein